MSPLPTDPSSVLLLSTRGRDSPSQFSLCVLHWAKEEKAKKDDIKFEPLIQSCKVEFLSNKVENIYPKNVLWKIKLFISKAQFLKKKPITTVLFHNSVNFSFFIGKKRTRQEKLDSSCVLLFMPITLIYFSRCERRVCWYADLC